MSEIKEFHLSSQKWLSEFKIKIKNVEPRAYVKGNVNRYALQAIVNGEEVEFHTSTQCFKFMFFKDFTDFFPEGDYYLYVKVRRTKIGDRYYSKPEYIKIKE